MSDFKNRKSKQNEKETLNTPYLTIGVVLGIVAGYLMDNIPAGIGFGIAIGAVISLMKSRKNR